MPENAYQQPLSDGLVLRTAASVNDVERVATFNGTIHGEKVATMTHHLFTHHPHTQLADLIFVDDTKNNQVVSSLCLIPWHWRYEGIEISAGEMGIVGTAEAYRRRGLIRAQAALFQRRLRARGCLLSHIQGIPYFYRQFGYEYALPLEGGLRLETRHIPAPPSTAWTLRLATVNDLPALMRFYDEASADLAIHAVRSESVWQYLMTHTQGTDTEHETWIAQDASGGAIGYVRLPLHHFGEELVVDEASYLGFDAALAVLHHLKTLVQERDKPGIRLNLPAGCALMRLARSLGAHDLGTYAWQIHIPDFAAFLRALAPLLERRIAASPFADLNQQVRLSLYRHTILLRFVEGRLVEVALVNAADEEPIRIPPLPFILLLLGHQTVDALRASYPDISIAPRWRLLVDTLFPQVPAFIHTIY